MKISRSFSRKLQVRQYEPIDIFCSAEIECDEKDKEKVSGELDRFVQTEVEKSLLAHITKPSKDNSKSVDVGIDDSIEDTQ